MKLYHGSDITIDKPEIAFNKGFSDLGQGFYLTDDYNAACGRALSRARRNAASQGVVSAYSFDEESIDWIELGSGADAAASINSAFGLRFADTLDGVVAWANYIKACRRGRTQVDGIGDPAIVRAWIATEEVEMVCSGFAPAEALAEFIDPAELVVQYCFRCQRVLNQRLVFEGADYLDCEV